MNTRSTTQSALTAIDHKKIKIEKFSTSTTVMSTTKDSEPINANPLNNNDNATAAENPTLNDNNPIESQQAVEVATTEVATTANQTFTPPSTPPFSTTDNNDDTAMTDATTCADEVVFTTLTPIPPTVPDDAPTVPDDALLWVVPDEQPQPITMKETPPPVAEDAETTAAIEKAIVASTINVNKEDIKIHNSENDDDDGDDDEDDDEDDDDDDDDGEGDDDGGDGVKINVNMNVNVENNVDGATGGLNPTQDPTFTPTPAPLKRSIDSLDEEELLCHEEFKEPTDELNQMNKKLHVDTTITNSVAC